MQISTTEIRQGHHNGKSVWICHYLQPDLNKKPLRNVKPIQVLIVSNEELPTNKRVYYSASHFRPITRKGTSSTIISPVDNTGYRSIAGNELYAFDNEDECLLCFEQQVKEVQSRISVEIETCVQKWTNMKSALETLIEKN